MNDTPINNDNNTGGSEIQNKKYEDLIIKLKTLVYLI